MPAPQTPAVPIHSGLDFRRAVWLLCLLFMTVQVLYILRRPLVMDEFQNAFTAHRFAEQVPYRDFVPYKTVLGYYLQLPMLQVVEGVWRPLLAVKMQMALMTAVVLGWVAVRLRRHFDPRAILIGLGLLLAMSTFLERSGALRLDMVTALAGLVGLTLMLDRRFALAGIATAVSFLLSQKGVYYVVAANFALGTAWLLTERSRRAFREALVFNLAALATLVSYLGFWALTTSLDSVVQATFFSHREIAFGNLYDNKLKYWSQTLRRNPLFYLLALLGLMRLAGARSSLPDRTRQVMLGSFGATLVALCILHRQPWPYFFVILLPTLWVLIVACLHVEFESWAGRTLLRRRLMVAILVAAGFLLPLSRVWTNARRDSGFQRSTLMLVDRLVGPDEGYVAGTELLFERPQKAGRIAWLDLPAARAINETPIYELERLRQDLIEAPAKLVVNNHRIYRLPPILRNHLDRNYTPFWGAVAIYGPALEPGRTTVDILFDGDYEILGGGASISIDGTPRASGDRFRLRSGTHEVDTAVAARLRYIPTGIDDVLDPDYREPQLLFPDVYTY